MTTIQNETKTMTGTLQGRGRGMLIAPFPGKDCQVLELSRTGERTVLITYTQRPQARNVRPL